MRLSLFSSKQCIIKQLLDSVFVISGVIKVEVRPLASADNTYLDLDYSGPKLRLSVAYLIFVMVIVI